MRATTQYECPVCRDLHDREIYANRCCAPRTARRVFVCAECDKRHGAEDDGEACCTYIGLHDFADLVPRCYFDGTPVGIDELRDSRDVGTMVRCRACLNKLGVPSVEQVIAA